MSTDHPIFSLFSSGGNSPSMTILASLNLPPTSRLLTMLLDRHVERVSRRMVLAILMLSDYIPGHKIAVLEQAFNRNLLGSFLLD
ncbi:Uncharacterized protein LOK49_LG08G00763 [Camellia lanceoleosa]|uniref:Uncharacterized protein n=1 Tax=Camellia lanceoleosa TaxID=1840588 RepID=A0ACC0GQJ0_9ERIC|nr:Uncharacterized protein LOK49_LG08G00763 [Camellia lanceoleosa]